MNAFCALSYVHQFEFLPLYRLLRSLAYTERIMLLDAHLDGQTLLLHAISAKTTHLLNKHRIVELLLRAGSNPSGPQSDNREHPLEAACREMHLMDALLHFHADPNEGKILEKIVDAAKSDVEAEMMVKAFLRHPHTKATFYRYRPASLELAVRKCFRRTATALLLENKKFAQGADPSLLDADNRLKHLADPSPPIGAIVLERQQRRCMFFCLGPREFLDLSTSTVVSDFKVGQYVLDPDFDSAGERRTDGWNESPSGARYSDGAWMVFNVDRDEIATDGSPAPYRWRYWVKKRVSI